MVTRLEWLQDLTKSLNRALGGQIRETQVLDSPDPLKKYVVFQLHEPIQKPDFKHFREITAKFSEANDCVAQTVSAKRMSVVVEVLLKYRNNPVLAKKKNPLVVEERTRGPKKSKL